jgi:ADP-ribose pyrophosphatase
VEEEVLASNRIYEGRIVSLRVDTVRLRSGREATREVVEHSDAVTILPVDADGNLLLVQQFRLPARRVLLEAPAGNVDTGEAPEDTAHRELREETGFDCRNLSRILGFYPAPGFSEEFMHCFVASDLYEAEADADEDEDLTLVRMTLAEALAAIRDGDLIDAKTIATVLAHASGLSIG